MEFAKGLAAHVFTELGFQVEEIPVCAGRSADLRIVDSELTYHVEVKEKFESAADADVRREQLMAGEVCWQTNKLSHDNRISGILRDAQKQLDQTDKDHSTFQLIWFHADGVDADLKYLQAFATFYGDVPVSSGRETTHCFYFDYSAAFVMPSIEAIVLSDHKQLQFCLNEFSPRAGEFRQSHLCRKFDSIGGVFDPQQIVRDGLAIACRATIPRKDDHETARALQEQTGLKYTPIRMNRYTGSAMVMFG